MSRNSGLAIIEGVEMIETYRKSVLASLRLVDYPTEYRVAHPSTALRIDSGSSPTAAIALFCRTCIGDNHPRDCTGYTCPLFSYRPGADDENANKRRPGDVPTEEQYRELQRLADPDGRRAQATRERFAASRAGLASVEDDDPIDPDLGL